MYIIALDIGSTNIKALVLSTEIKNKEENIKLIGKVRKKTTDFTNFFYEIKKDFNIESESIECIVVTGTGASFLEDSVDDIKIFKVDEFAAIGYGGIVLSKLNEAIITSIGTGTTIVHSNLNINEWIGGTGLGGGTFVGLSNIILQNRLKNNDIMTFLELIEMAKNGNRLNVDLSIGDISKNSIGNMSKDITAANFAAVNKEFTECDLIAGVSNMVLENISLIVKAVNKNDLPVVYIGTMVTDDFVKERLKEIAEYTGSKIYFIENADYAIAIGAWEYYLLRHREVI